MLCNVYKIVHFVGSPQGPPVFLSDFLVPVPLDPPLAGTGALSVASDLDAAAGAAAEVVAGAASDAPPCSQPKCLAATDQK